jgi:hypothetical protein
VALKPRCRRVRADFVQRTREAKRSGALAEVSVVLAEELVRGDQPVRFARTRPIETRKRSPAGRGVGCPGNDKSEAHQSAQPAGIELGPHVDAAEHTICDQRQQIVRRTSGLIRRSM